MNDSITMILSEVFESKMSQSSESENVPSQPKVVRDDDSKLAEFQQASNDSESALSTKAAKADAPMPQGCDDAEQPSNGQQIQLEDVPLMVKEYEEGESDSADESDDDETSQLVTDNSSIHKPLYLQERRRLEQQKALEDSAEEIIEPFKMIKKGAVAALGGTMVTVGLVMIPLPTPFGAVVASSGLAVLGTEFEGAKVMNDRIIHTTKHHLESARDGMIRGIESMDSEGGEAEDEASGHSEDESKPPLSPSPLLHMNPMERVRQEKIIKEKGETQKKDRGKRSAYQQTMEYFTKHTGSFLSRTLLPMLKRNAEAQEVEADCDVTSEGYESVNTESPKSVVSIEPSDHAFGFDEAIVEESEESASVSIKDDPSMESAEETVEKRMVETVAEDSAESADNSSLEESAEETVEKRMVETVAKDSAESADNSSLEESAEETVEKRMVETVAKDSAESADNSSLEVSEKSASV